MPSPTRRAAYQRGPRSSPAHPDAPAGIAACLTPWNFPLSIQARKVAPALAAGCTLVARASEKAPLAVVELFRALVDAGLPPGVANLVQGPSASQSTALLDHPSVRVVSFTGSTPVGASIMTRAARRIVRCALELGGDAPFLVFSDADLDAAVQGLLLAKFRNNGQSCIAANRVFVEEPVLGEFCERLASAMEQIGPIGPLIDEERVAAVEELTEAAIRGGASFVAEAPRSNGPCWSRAGFMVGVRRRFRSRNQRGLRTGGRNILFLRRGGGRRTRQRHRNGPSRLCLDPRPRPVVGGSPSGWK